MRRVILLVLILFVGISFGRAHAGKDWGRELKHAAKALSDGDYAEAYSAYRKIAVENGNPLAMFSAGLFHRNGWGMQMNPDEACRWFKTAARGDIPAAVHFYAECLLEGTGAAPDPSEAALLLEKAVSLGYHGSLLTLAEMNMEGRGVPKNPDKALEFCRQAAERGVVRAQAVMGRFLLTGDRRVRDPAAARPWFEAAAGRGIPEAEYYLGVMARDGIALPPSPLVARNWFELAASRGYVPAYLPAGELYFATPPGKKPAARDLAKAYLWLSAAVRASGKGEGEGPERAEKLLSDVRAIMPPTWAPELDAKVDAHMAEHPVQE